VYGGNEQRPSHEAHRTGTPLSLYAATKLAAEALAHANSHLNNIPTTVFRFFTVYGPWCRPDMALLSFVDAMLQNRAIDIYGEGQMERDFTYIDDLVAPLIALIDHPPAIGQPIGPTDTLSPVAPYRTINLGGGKPVQLMTFVSAIEAAMGLTAEKRFLPMQPGDVKATAADSSLLKALTGLVPATPLQEGINNTVAWYRSYLAGHA
jgi:UDP-glucuronate 4-epimerase